MKKTLKRKLRGEYTILFLALAVPAFILMMMVTYDFGNFLLMRSTTRAIADSAAIAAGGAVDMGGASGTTGGTGKGSSYTLTEAWPASRVNSIITTSTAKLPKHLKNRMQFSLSGLEVIGKEATVQITGTYTPMWTAYSDSSLMTTTVTQKVRAATGTVIEVK